MRVELDGNADAVEFCPDDLHSDLLAAATYTLVESTNTRLGSVSLFEVGKHGVSGDSLGFRLLDRVKTTSGVFDIKWRPQKLGSVPLLAQATADGSLRLYSLQEHSSLKELTSLDVTDSMCLFVEWDPFGRSTVVSQSDGSLSIVNMSEAGLELETTWEAHSLEAWTATYDAFNQGLIYSGADDCHFCGWDLRVGPSSPIFREKDSHEMGVCCIQSNPERENVIGTGSYDENIRVWDRRMMGRPHMNLKLGLGGGVWKFKWNPFDKDVILAACMHNGFSVVNVNQGVIKEFKEHESLGYGADWSRRRGWVATCSFYDKALRVWNTQDETGIYS